MSGEAVYCLLQHRRKSGSEAEKGDPQKKYMGNCVSVFAVTRHVVRTTYVGRHDA